MRPLAQGSEPAVGDQLLKTMDQQAVAYAITQHSVRYIIKDQCLDVPKSAVTVGTARLTVQLWTLVLVVTSARASGPLVTPASECSCVGRARSKIRCKLVCRVLKKGSEERDSPSPSRNAATRAGPEWTNHRTYLTFRHDFTPFRFTSWTGYIF